MLFRYLGADAGRMYLDYVDAATGRMLEPVPDAVYGIRVAPGRNPGLPLPPGDGRWAAVSDDEQAAEWLIAAAGALPETAQEPAADEVPEPGPELPPEPPEGVQEPQDMPAPDDPAAPEGEPEPPDPAAEATDPVEGSD